MTRQAQLFRIRFVGRSGTVHEVEIAARDAAEAIRAVRELEWPPRAFAFRLIDAKGREVFEQLKTDLR